jgi:hypothetical protein
MGELFQNEFRASSFIIIIVDIGDLMNVRQCQDITLMVSVLNCHIY